jgi:hypothetical protein
VPEIMKRFENTPGKLKKATLSRDFSGHKIRRYPKGKEIDLEKIPNDLCYVNNFKNATCCYHAGLRRR